MGDVVHSPSHYAKGGVECIEAIKASMTTEAFAGYCKGNVMKYIFRYEDKGGVTDLKKAQVYLNWLIEAASKMPAKVSAHTWMLPFCQCDRCAWRWAEESQDRPCLECYTELGYIGVPSKLEKVEEDESGNGG